MIARVAITGIGLLTPLGLDRETSWHAIIEGKLAARWLSPDELTTKCGVRSPGEYSANAPRAGSVRSWPIAVAGAPVTLPRNSERSRLTEFALRVASEAVSDRGGLNDVAPDRRGVVLGTSKTDLYAVEALPEALFPSHPCSAVAQTFECRGPSLAPVAACATGLLSLIRGAELIRSGDCDIVLAGSVDASLHPAVLASYRRLGVLAKPGDDPAAACRPFDAARSGFVIGEGGAVLILERWETALARGTPTAEWVGGMVAADVAGITQVDCTGTSLSELVTRTLQRFRVSANEIDIVSMHGTATRQNDIAESRGLRNAFGTAADRLSCFSIKGGIGHLLGAAGAVETAVTALSLQRGIVPPTVNLTDPDWECRLDYTASQARRRDANCALKLSLGFGGHLATAILRQSGFR